MPACVAVSTGNEDRSGRRHCGCCHVIVVWTFLVQVLHDVLPNDADLAGQIDPTNFGSSWESILIQAALKYNASLRASECTLWSIWGAAERTTG